jgi:predicted ester cyclase
MAVADNKAIVQSCCDSINSGHGVEGVDRLFAPDFVAHLPGRPYAIRSREKFEVLLNAYLTAFPDFEAVTDDLVGEGDLVAIRETYKATHTGHYKGMVLADDGKTLDIPPTGKRIDLTGIDIYRVVDGKIVEQWIEQDLLGLLRQLGAVRVEHVKG